MLGSGLAYGHKVAALALAFRVQALALKVQALTWTLRV